MINDLKIRLVETLKYPRYLMRAELKLEDCPHDGHIDSSDPVCQQCIDTDDCRWLVGLDDSMAPEDQPLDKLISALGYAIDTVASLLEEGRHDSLCHCDACLWRKQADRLYGEARCHPELGPPPMPY